MSTARRTKPAEPTEPAESPAFTSLYCHATYRARLTRASTELCNRFLGHVRGQLQFAGVARRAPDQPDGRTWVRCPRSDCHAWNIFDAVDE